MNLSNKLTLSRIAVIPFFLVALTPARFAIGAGWNPELHLLALLLFVAASITDYYDGALARRHGWITNFGKLLDPLADKVLVMAAFVGLIEQDIFPSWMVVLVLAREFLITGLRMLAVAQGRILSADRWGKNKTISQLTTIITALVFITAQDWLTRYGLWERVVVRQWEIDQILRIVLKSMMGFCVLITIWSGWRYMRSNWDILEEN
jgi:CDP-diacylglycerol--glycerol-3-phosphate 3-phosphatidyltransferase